MFKRASILLIGSFLLVLPSFGQNFNPDKFVVDSAIVKMKAAIQMIDNFYVDSVDKNDLVEKMIITTLKDLDPHSVYISKEDIRRMNEPLVGNFEGVGIQFNIFKDTILVVSPISGGPSEKVGILPGDKIVMVDDELVAGIGIKNSDVMSKLRGAKGTKVVVGIYRRGESELLDFTITRDKIPIYSVDASYMATPKTGYIKLNRFSRPTMKEINQAMIKLSTLGMENLILNLRGNSGGYLNVAVQLADEFLSSKQLIVYSEGRSYQKRVENATSRGNFDKGKLIVLIDEGSASASEIVSGAIQDHDRGLIIGRRSFGKGLVQKPYPLPDGSAVRLTVARYYTPSGRSIQRPYSEGKEKYYKDLESRFVNGELTNMDSINFPDSLKFKTDHGRIVYGGGGVMPDVFVPIDTTYSTAYLGRLNRKGVFYEFILDYMDENRENMTGEYSSLNKFESDFKVDGKVMKQFLEFAETKKVEYDEKQFKRSKAFIEIRIKALMARNLFDNSAFYQIINPINTTYQKALEMMEDDKRFSKLEVPIKK